MSIPKESETLPVMHTHARWCPLCKRWFAPNEEQRTPDGLLSFNEEPLASFENFMAAWFRSEDGSPYPSDAFLAYMSLEGTAQAARLDAFANVLRYFATEEPILFAVIDEHGRLQRSDRQIAVRLGLTHPTVAVVISRARDTLRDLFRDAGLLRT